MLLSLIAIYNLSYLTEDENTNLWVFFKFVLPISERMRAASPLWQWLAICQFADFFSDNLADFLSYSLHLSLILKGFNIGQEIYLFFFSSFLSADFLFLWRVWNIFLSYQPRHFFQTHLNKFLSAINYKIVGWGMLCFFFLQLTELII